MKKLLRQILWQARVVGPLPGLRIIDQDANDPLDLANRGGAELPLTAKGNESLQLTFSGSTQRLGLRALLHGRHTGSRTPSCVKPSLEVGGRANDQRCSVLTPRLRFTSATLSTIL